MRVIINFICLCVFLLGGGQYLHAAAHPGTISDSPSWNFVKKQHVKLRTAEPGSVLIEDADVDLDEEFHRSDDLKNGGANKTLAVKHSLLDHWYLTFSSTFIFKDYSKLLEIFTPNCGYSNPIYLRIGVLRI
ncbi:hypothetical protein [Flavobacterium taihuense]|uniref:hypothetical protein n=1 Tax=Flavobacterium taihuense TaxID=2857508 RepID=UPI002107B533|nr:hypothetical protein [Flavobacterium taihuense]